MDLTKYDAILVNTSAGKDSQAMLDEIVRIAREQGVAARVTAVHCDLGRMEWQGTRELAEEQCAAYGVPLRIVSRPQGNLLSQVEQRGKWPDSARRYCTSDHKRGQAAKVIVALHREWKARGGTGTFRLLSCMGLRAQESPARAKRVPFQRDDRLSTETRVVDAWLPIHDWSTDQVWERIRQSGVRHHRAYDLGMPRLSCCFCIFAPKAALVLAGKHNRELLDEYVAVEARIQHSFRQHLSLAEVQEAVLADEQTDAVASWTM